MSEFPRADLEQIARECRRVFIPEKGLRMASTVRVAIRAYDQLAERCVMDRTESSLEISRLRAEVERLTLGIASLRTRTGAT